MPRAKNITHEKLTAEQEILITDNLKLVYYCFGKLYYNEFKSSHADDFCSEGFIGLIKAARTFDSAKGCTFATYASRCIMNQFLMYLRHLRKKEGRCVSLETVVSEDGGNTLTLADIIPDTRAEREIESIALKVDIDNFLVTESERDKQIFRLVLQGYKQSEIADKLGIARSYVSRLYSKIKERYRNHKSKEAQIAA